MSGASGSVAHGAHVPVVEGGKDYEQDVVLGKHPELVEAHCIVFTAELPNDMLEAWHNFEKMRSLVQSYAQHTVSVDAEIYEYKYEFALADYIMPIFGLKNLLQAGLAVFVCLCLFLPPRIAAICTMTVGFIDVLLLGMMVFLDLPLNTITLVSLLLGLALSVDYSCHIGHAYVMASGATREAKVKDALDKIGFSIFNAGGSTLLGTLFLSASQSPIFRTFFVLVWGAICLGLIAGLAFVPAVLSFIGPLQQTAHKAMHMERGHASRPASSQAQRASLL